LDYESITNNTVSPKILVAAIAWYWPALRTKKKQSGSAFPNA